MTQVIAEQIDQMITAYGPDEVIRAVTDACMANVRKPTYVRGILQRRANGGGQPGADNGAAARAEAAETARRRKFVRDD